MEQLKTFKQYCKEAKKRLKSGFWRDYNECLERELVMAKEAGVSQSKVKDYYVTKVSDDIKRVKNADEEFYQKVKKILDEEGEISNAIGRLTDKALFATLSYEEKQRYSLELSEKYLKAVERYNKENALSFAR